MSKMDHKNMNRQRLLWIIINILILTPIYMAGFVFEERSDVPTKIFQCYIFLVCSISAGYFLLKGRQTPLTKTFLVLWVVCGLVLIVRLILGHDVFLMSMLYVFASFILSAIFKIAENKCSRNISPILCTKNQSLKEKQAYVRFSFFMQWFQSDIAPTFSTSLEST